MNNNMPHTPFSTPLSGSARETEIRLKNIFSGPKKRPPVLFLALMFSICVFCGNLVSCQARPVDEPDGTSHKQHTSPAGQGEGTDLYHPGQFKQALSEMNPIAPASVYHAAQEYIDQTEYAGTPIARLEQMAEWTDFTGISLCPEWQDKEDLTLVSYDVDYNDPGEMSGMSYVSHLLFLKEGDGLTFLTAFYDGALSTPEPDYLAGLSPYNWYASVALADAGYLTARPRMANTITQAPVPQAAWRLAADWCENHPEEGLTAERLEPVAVVTTEPGWVAVYRMNGEYLAFFEISDFRAFYSCLTVRPEHGVSSLEKAALSAYWGLLDSEVALWDLSQMPYYASAVGPGANRDFFLTGQDESLADGSGSWTVTGRLFEARFRTVPGSEGGWGGRFTEYLNTTRRLPTTRGAVIGDSLDKVRADYPELRNDLVTGAWVYHGEQGAVMEFYFEKNILSRIILKEGNE